MTDLTRKIISFVKWKDDYTTVLASIRRSVIKAMQIVSSNVPAILRTCIITLSGFLLSACFTHPLFQQEQESETENNESLLLLLFPGIQTQEAGLDPGPGYKRIFLTQAWTDGNFSDLGGGTPTENIDAFCNSDANNPDSGAVFKAMIHAGASGGRRGPCLTPNCSGGASEHVDWVFRPDTEYRRADGITVIGRTMPSLGLFDFGAGDLDASFGSNSGTYWTGINTNWTEGTNCSRWINIGSSARLGDEIRTNVFAVSVVDLSCNANQRVVCVEQ